MEIKKYTSAMPVSCCVITDSTGVNHCHHPAPTPSPWHRHLRWAVSSWWYVHAPRVHFGPCNHDDFC